MHKLIRQIVAAGTPVYFVSPHFDDAALSAGALISYLAPKTRVTVINLFTSVHSSKPTLSAAAFVRQCGYASAKQLFSDRLAEDAGVFRPFGVKVVNLGFIDSLWRLKPDLSALEKFFGRYLPELIHIYPTYRFHAIRGRVSRFDDGMAGQVAVRLKKLVKEPSAVVFCPLGIGGHVDHLFTKNVCCGLFSKLVYWVDFPYSARQNFHSGFHNSFSVPVNQKDKTRLLRGYASQFSALFPDGRITQTSETFLPQ